MRNVAHPSVREQLKGALREGELKGTRGIVTGSCEMAAVPSPHDVAYDSITCTRALRHVALRVCVCVCVRVRSCDPVHSKHTTHTSHTAHTHTHTCYV